MADHPPPRYGLCEQVAPGIRRVLAPNPSAYTYSGTGTYIIGDGDVAVIDPGPADDTHINALMEAVEGERVSHILVTHNHRDHSPATAALKAATGAAVHGCAPLAAEDSGPRIESGFDHQYRPDRVMADQDRVEGYEWTLEAVATPGHTSNHLCFAFPQQKALFTGDHVMGWSTTVVSPPDGDMGDYMRSLEKLLSRKETVFYPTHGAPISNPVRLVRAMLTHRRQREYQILALLSEAPCRVPGLVTRMYAGLAPALQAAAGQSVLAHLLDLRGRGKVFDAQGEWALAGNGHIRYSELESHQAGKAE